MTAFPSVDRPRRQRVHFGGLWNGTPDCLPLPERIDRLRELALDLWWSWNNSARQVFREARLSALARDRAQSGAHAAA